MKHTEEIPNWKKARKAGLIALGISLVFLAGAYLGESQRKEIRLSATTQWCQDNPEYADWAKQRYEKVLKAAKEVYLEK